MKNVYQWFNRVRGLVVILWPKFKLKKKPKKNNFCDIGSLKYLGTLLHFSSISFEWYNAPIYIFFLYMHDLFFPIHICLTRRCKKKKIWYISKSMHLFRRPSVVMIEMKTCKFKCPYSPPFFFALFAFISSMQSLF